MSDERLYDSNEWVDETGASTGDARENDPRSAGFTNRTDRLYRSQFQRVNRLADRADADPPDEIEKDVENGWLNVRVARVIGPRRLTWLRSSPIVSSRGA